MLNKAFARGTVILIFHEDAVLSYFCHEIDFVPILEGSWLKVRFESFVDLTRVKNVKRSYSICRLH